MVGNDRTFKTFVDEYFESSSLREYLECYDYWNLVNGYVETRYGIYLGFFDMYINDIDEESELDGIESSYKLGKKSQTLLFETFRKLSKELSEEYEEFCQEQEFKEHYRFLKEKSQEIEKSFCKKFIDIFYGSNNKHNNIEEITMDSIIGRFSPFLDSNLKVPQIMRGKKELTSFKLNFEYFLNQLSSYGKFTFYFVKDVYYYWQDRAIIACDFDSDGDRSSVRFIYFQLSDNN
ncbi:hypothetical protein [Tenacibaculum xiamenense]|uniref:hypothetical protein n=1 Tax=Tenacibaculum xiamenense TaxID=1261553 RepID=UPI0038938DF7